MRPTVAKLVDAARGLRLRRAEGPHGVQIGAKPADLPLRLRAVLEALEALDAEGAPAAEADPKKLSDGIDAVFRWIAAQGLSTDEPLAVLARALGKPARKPKLVPMPRFAPGFRKKKDWKPRLTLARNMDDDLHATSAEGLRDQSFRMHETARLLGHAVAAPAVAAEPEPLTMGPC